MKLIVGLGNPGKEYENTRHNVGFIVLDNYVNDLSWKKDNDTMIASNVIEGEKIYFIKPLTYMNLSGKSVARIANYYKISSKDILVIHDDLDLSSMRYRLKYNSSSGGHNGINDIIKQLNTTEFARLKIGIGKNDNIDTRDYVLGKLSKKEIEFLKSDIFIDIINGFIKYNIDYVMNKYN